MTRCTRCGMKIKKDRMGWYHTATAEDDCDAYAVAAHKWWGLPLGDVQEAEKP